MNRIDPSPRIRRLSPRATVISGAALGLIAGAAVFGAVSSSASSHTATPTVFKQVSATRHITPAKAAPCGKGQELDHGVCIVHVVRTVVVAAPGGGNQNSGPSGSTSPVSQSASHDSASRAEPGEGAEGAEPGDDAAEHAQEAEGEAAAHAKEAAAEAAAHAKEGGAPVTADR
jgi:hypothetical protein